MALKQCHCRAVWANEISKISIPAESSQSLPRLTDRYTRFGARGLRSAMPAGGEAGRGRRL